MIPKIPIKRKNQRGIVQKFPMVKIEDGCIKILKGKNIRGVIQKFTKVKIKEK